MKTLPHELRVTNYTSDPGLLNRISVTFFKRTLVSCGDQKRGSGRRARRSGAVPEQEASSIVKE
ncbi:hypothetical protein KIL84_016429 [Mauremys mutica]|uniref:Uncharacterized protein n=1 Tax=Mauremys mutica TaxID=74926 RepID=A0A9D4AXR3_9SAUR|nr:hypothetical protein KIL84_016429 [Mauremys mutica]